MSEIGEQENAVMCAYLAVMGYFTILKDSAGYEKAVSTLGHDGESYFKLLGKAANGISSESGHLDLDKFEAILNQIIVETYPTVYKASLGGVELQ